MIVAETEHYAIAVLPPELACGPEGPHARILAHYEALLSIGLEPIDRLYGVTVVCRKVKP